MEQTAEVAENQDDLSDENVLSSQHRKHNSVSFTVGAPMFEEEEEDSAASETKSNLNEMHDDELFDGNDEIFGGKHNSEETAAANVDMDLPGDGELDDSWLEEGNFI